LSEAETELLLTRTKKLIAIKNVLVSVRMDAIPSTGGIEAACKHFCIGPESGLSDTKSVIVIGWLAGSGL
jgi:hypothetical protein